MSISLGQGNRPLTNEEKCSLYSVSSEDYFKCINKAQVQLFPQRIDWLGWILIFIILIFGGPLVLELMSGQSVKHRRY